MASIYRKCRDLTYHLNDTLFGQPEIIIFGENHVDPTHQEEQAKAILKYKPEYVLLECLNDLNPDETVKLNNIYNRMTLNELAKNFNLDLEDGLITSNAISGIEEYLENYVLGLAEHFIVGNIYNPEKAKEAAMKSVYSGTVPENVEQLITAPLYNFSSASYMAILKLFSDENITPEDSLSSSDNVWNLKNYLTQIEPILRNNFPHEVMRASAITGAKLAGCDIDKDDLPKTDTEDASTPGDLVSSLTDLRDYVDDVNQEREETMSARIAKYVRMRKTGNPVIAIVGGSHLKNGSILCTDLISRGINYRAIRQKSKIAEDESYKYALDLILKK